MSVLKGFEFGVQESIKANPNNPGDYIGSDGLLYCGTCNSRKERLMTVMGKEYRPRIPCRCRMEEAEKATVEEKSKLHEKKVADLLYRSNYPPEYAEASFDVWRKRKDNVSILPMLKRYAEHFLDFVDNGKGLLLHGNVGTGKTYAAACVGHAVMELEKTVFFTSTNDMLILRSEEDEAKYRRRISATDLLIIDDLGAERGNDFGRTRVYFYIDLRTNSGKPMIVTSNIDFNRFLNPENPDEARTYDRVLKRCFPIAFAGESWRRIEARESFSDMKALLEGKERK